MRSVVLPLLFFPFYPGSLRFFTLFLVPMQVLNLLSFAYLSRTSVTSTPLHYEVQLRITSRQIILIYLTRNAQTFLLQFTFFKCINLLNYFLFVCLFICLFVYLLILLLCLLKLNNTSAATLHQNNTIKSTCTTYRAITVFPVKPSLNFSRLLLSLSLGKETSEGTGR